MTSGNPGLVPDPTSRPLISRFTMLLLALVLIGMGVGANIPVRRAEHCLLFGCYGLGAFVTLEFATRWRFRRRDRATRDHIEQTLARRVALLSEQRSGAPDLACAGAVTVSTVRRSNSTKRALIVCDGKTPVN